MTSESVARDLRQKKLQIDMRKHIVVKTAHVVVGDAQSTKPRPTYATSIVPPLAPARCGAMATMRSRTSLKEPKGSGFASIMLSATRTDQSCAHGQTHR